MSVKKQKVSHKELQLLIDIIYFFFTQLELYFSELNIFLPGIEILLNKRGRCDVKIKLC